jgi:hypothetical protein
MRECIGNLVRLGRPVHGVDDLGSWNLVLGDSITRRMVAEYAHPSLQTGGRSSARSCRSTTSARSASTASAATARSRRSTRARPYQPLTSPGNEEVTYALAKKGGTEDLTFEMIANDDVRAISDPGKLGLAAAQTLLQLRVGLHGLTNPTHLRLDGAVHRRPRQHQRRWRSASQTLSRLRLKMRDQTAYGDTSDILVPGAAVPDRAERARGAGLAALPPRRWHCRSRRTPGRRPSNTRTCTRA